MDWKWPAVDEAWGCMGAPSSWCMAAMIESVISAGSLVRPILSSMRWMRVCKMLKLTAPMSRVPRDRSARLPIVRTCPPGMARVGEGGLRRQGVVKV